MTLKPSPWVDRAPSVWMAYAVLRNGYFWMPVFFLWFLEHLPLAQVLWLEAIYYLAVVVCEVPAGWVSDRTSRKWTLVASGLLQTVSAGCMALGSDLATFAVGQVLFAASMALNSGTDTALHLELLQRAGRESEFGAREARAATLSFALGAGAALAGGFGYGWQPVAVWWATAGCSALALLAALALPADGRQPGAAQSLAQDFGMLGLAARSAALRWAFGLSVLMVVLNHIPYEFVGPWLEAGPATEGWGLDAAQRSGLQMAAAMIVGAWVARFSVRGAARWGVVPWVIAAAAVQVAVIATMAAGVYGLAAWIPMLRGVPRAMQQAPLSAWVVPQIPAQVRATWLSLQSLGGRLAFAGLLVGMGALTNDAEAPEGVAASLRLSLLVATVGLGALLAFRPRQAAADA